MKRSIIFLMALIVLCAFPVFASTPEQDMVLIVDEGDGEFSGLEQVSDEEMSEIFGNKIEGLQGEEPYFNFNLAKNQEMVPGDEYINFFWSDGAHVNHVVHLTMGSDGLWHGTVDGKSWKGSNYDLFDQFLAQWRSLNIVELASMGLMSIFL
ncbi:MAG: hypothetical protein KBG82_06480 [Spirochaetes bacterium]|nr:hypothetical protein [Spirochaetota bacterium]